MAVKPSVMRLGSTKYDRSLVLVTGGGCSNLEIHFRSKGRPPNQAQEEDSILYLPENIF